MDRLERINLVEQLEAYVTFHEDKANYYHEWLEEERLKASTIGFVLNENTEIRKINTVTISAEPKTIEDWL